MAIPRHENTSPALGLWSHEEQGGVLWGAADWDQDVDEEMRLDVRDGNREAVGRSKETSVF